MTTRSLKRNFAYSSAYQVLNIIVPLITTPYLSRTIGAEGNGLFTYTQSIANYFVFFAQLGITNYGVREIARCGANRTLRSKTFWNIFAMSLIWGALVVLAYLAYAFTLGSANLLLSLIWLCWVVGSVVDVTWLLNGCQEFRIPVMRNFCTRLAGMVAIFVFVHDAGDTWAYVAAVSVPFFVNALLVWPFVRHYVDFRMPTMQGAFAHLRPNFVLFVPVIAVSLYTLLDKVLLGAMAGMNQTGLYDYAEKVSKMPLAVITALGAVVLPRMTEVISSGRRSEAKGLITMTMWFMEVIAMGLTFGIMAVANEFVPVFFGTGYDECTLLMTVLSVIIPLICATNVIGVQYLVSSGRDLQYTVSVLVGAAVNIVINLLLIPYYGALTAAVATVAAELVVLVVQVWMVRSELDLASAALGTVPFMVMGMVMLACVRLLVGLMGAFAATVPGLVVEVLAGSVIYAVLTIVWCIATKNVHFIRLFGRWLPKGNITGEGSNE